MPSGVYERSPEQKECLRKMGAATKGKANGEYIHGNRIGDKDWPEAHRCRSKLRSALLTNKIKKEPCKICGNPNIVGHHEDYSKPYDVIWVCRKHHYQIHYRLPITI